MARCLPMFWLTNLLWLQLAGPGAFSEILLVSIFLHGLSPLLQREVNRNPQTGNVWLTLKAAFTAARGAVKRLHPNTDAALVPLADDDHGFDLPDEPGEPERKRSRQGKRDAN